MHAPSHHTPSWIASSPEDCQPARTPMTAGSGTATATFSLGKDPNQQGQAFVGAAETAFVTGVPAGRV